MNILSTQRKYFLRTRPASLSSADVRELVKRYGFYSCEGDEIFRERNEYSNPQGYGIHALEPNVYALYNRKLIVYDRLTGLCWQRGGSPCEFNWYQADSYTMKLRDEVFGGLSQWRLPTLEEAMSLVESSGQNIDTNHPQWTALHINPIFEANQRWIWTIDSYYKKAWKVNFAVGACDLTDIKENGGFVRAVCSNTVEEDKLQKIEPKDLEKIVTPTSTKLHGPSASLCDFCKGTGKQSCQMCGSSGSVTRYFSGVYQTTTMTTPCPKCGGSGFVSCHRCHGAGRAS